MITVSIIGCGNMGGGIITALKESGGYSLTVYDSDREKAEKFNLNTAPTLEAALEKSDVIILAVKPQIISELYDTLSEYKHKSFQDRMRQSRTFHAQSRGKIQKGRDRNRIQQ